MCIFSSQKNGPAAKGNKQQSLLDIRMILTPYLQLPAELNLSVRVCPQLCSRCDNMHGEKTDTTHSYMTRQTYSHEVLAFSVSCN